MIIKKIFAYGAVLCLFVIPLFVSAQTPLGPPPNPFDSGSSGQITNLDSLVRFVITFINRGLIPIVFTIALLYFLWGVAMYIGKAGDKGAREEGIRIMTWGIIALFVMTSVWGLVNILVRTFRLDNAALPAPQFRR